MMPSYDSRAVADRTDRDDIVFVETFSTFKQEPEELEYGDVVYKYNNFEIKMEETNINAKGCTDEKIETVNTQDDNKIIRGKNLTKVGNKHFPFTRNLE